MLTPRFRAASAPQAGPRRIQSEDSHRISGEIRVTGPRGQSAQVPVSYRVILHGYVMRVRIDRSLFAGLLLLGCAVVLPQSAFAAEESDKWGIWLDVGRFFNLMVVVGVLVWVARKPLANFFVTRTQTIRERLAEAQAARKEAEAKLAEIESRMSRLDEELAGIKEQAEREAQEEYSRVLSAAERDAEKIIERARQEIEGMTRAAHNELKAHAADLSIRLAEDRIRQEITDEDRNRFISGFVQKLGGGL